MALIALNDEINEARIAYLEVRGRLREDSELFARRSVQRTEVSPTTSGRSGRGFCRSEVRVLGIHDYEPSSSIGSDADASAALLEEDWCWEHAGRLCDQDYRGGIELPVFPLFHERRQAHSLCPAWTQQRHTIF